MEIVNTRSCGIDLSWPGVDFCDSIGWLGWMRSLAVITHIVKFHSFVPKRHHHLPPSKLIPAVKQNKKFLRFSDLHFRINLAQFLHSFAASKIDFSARFAHFFPLNQHKNTFSHRIFWLTFLCVDDVLDNRQREHEIWIRPRWGRFEFGFEGCELVKRDSKVVLLKLEMWARIPFAFEFRGCQWVESLSICWCAVGIGWVSGA